MHKSNGLLLALFFVLLIYRADSDAQRFYRRHGLEDLRINGKGLGAECVDKGEVVNLLGGAGGLRAGRYRRRGHVVLGAGAGAVAALLRDAVCCHGRRRGRLR